MEQAHTDSIGSQSGTDTDLRWPKVAPDLIHGGATTSGHSCHTEDCLHLCASGDHPLTLMLVVGQDIRAK